jgi:hypothetical protein
MPPIGVGDEVPEPGQPRIAPGAAGEVTASGAIDPSFGDGRAPTDMNWGIQDLPERVQDNALAFVVRRGLCKNAEHPRLDFSVVKILGWILAIRRAVFRQHNRSPEPESITLLAPHYKEGVGRMYSDFARATRFIQLVPLEAATSTWMRR